MLRPLIFGGFGYPELNMRNHGKQTYREGDVHITRDLYPLQLRLAFPVRLLTGMSFVFVSVLAFLSSMDLATLI